MLHREYNDSVDTNVSLYRRLDFDRGIIRDQDASKEVVLTTNHYVKLLTLQRGIRQVLMKLEHKREFYAKMKKNSTISEVSPEPILPAIKESRNEQSFSHSFENSQIGDDGDLNDSAHMKTDEDHDFFS